MCLIGSLAQNAVEDPMLAEAEALNKQVVTLYNQEKYDEALAVSKRAVALYENKAGKDDLRTALALKNLAQVYYKLDEKKNAKKAFNDALDIYEKNVPLSNVNEKRYVELLETVAIFEAGDSDIKGAEKKLTKALEIREKINGPNSSQVSSILYSIAQIYRISGEYKKALPLLMRSIDIATGADGKVKDAPPEMLLTTTCIMNKLGKESEVAALEKKFSSSYPKTEKLKDPKTIQGGIVNGKAKSLPIPRYPVPARAKGISGRVNVQVLIDESGKVIFACATSGPIELQGASEAAAYTSQFSPTKLSGKPVRVSGVISYMFAR